MCCIVLKTLYICIRKAQTSKIRNSGFQNLPWPKPKSIAMNFKN